MADRYANFAELAAHEIRDEDYRVLAARKPGVYAIVALHGGGIEPGTSELAEAIAFERHAFYAFEGIRASDNARLHITSTHFDEPSCLELIGACTTVVTLHGERGEASGEQVLVGGRDETLGRRVAASLREVGLGATQQGPSDLDGTDPRNLCNRGQSRAGVQLELPRALRAMMFRDLTRAGREQTTEAFGRFVAALRLALCPVPRGVA